MRNPNLELLTRAAVCLGPLLPEIVFVGGCATALLIDDPGAAPVRGTFDVDVVAEITSYPEYLVFSDRLRGLGFHEDDSEGAPLCRWLHTDLILDVMPIEANVLGFFNRWYPQVLDSAITVQLARKLTVRLITAPCFLGTKLEAFRGRGRSDYFASHDLEDFVAVVDGRTSILEEMQEAPSELRAYVGEAVGKLFAEPRFLDALPGYLLPDESNQAAWGTY